ncbi:MAG: NapC/NirT family cytochrome c [Motiliproteus sp.]
MPHVLSKLLSRKIILGTSIGVGLIFMAIGVIFWGGFNTAMQATNTMEFCIGCHEMKDNVYVEYKETIHYQNRSGVRAVCSDCHVPRDWTYKMIRKIQASKEVWGKITGVIDTREKFQEHRIEMAAREWARMKSTDSRECRNCHDFNTMMPENQKPRARKQHINAMTAGNTCIDCHKGIAHESVHDQLSDEEMEELSKPNPDNAIELPQHWKDFLVKEEADKQRAKEEKKAAIEAAKIAKAKAAEEAAKQAAIDAEKAKADAATAKAAGVKAKPVAKAQPVAMTKAAAKPAASSVDWDLVADRTVTVFFPGQTSIEWVMRGKDHGGARPVKAGDRCVDCHDQETADMGEKIVTGKKEGVEPTPIPGKRGSIAVSVKAAHDTDNLYLRFQWTNSEHTPAPFVDGGKMDPKNQMKLALMLADDNSDKFASQAGCWGTCHADLDGMPFAPEGQQVSKYLMDSRTKVEMKGRRGKALGGWDKRKEDGDIKAEFDAGRFMDILRYKGGEELAETGYILADREMNHDDMVKFNARKEGDQWIVEVKRKLNTGKPGDIVLSKDNVYNLGFAIHDDYTNARFHHVSLGYKLGFDNDDVEINSAAQ